MKMSADEFRRRFHMMIFTSRVTPQSVPAKRVCISDAFV